MASFTSRIMPVRISTGMVGVGNKIYAEIWMVGIDEYELRVLIRKPSNVAFRDIITIPKFVEWTFVGSFACTPIRLCKDYHVNMVIIENKVDYLIFKDMPFRRENVYTNNKGTYKNVYSYKEGWL